MLICLSPPDLSIIHFSGSNASCDDNLPQTGTPDAPIQASGNSIYSKDVLISESLLIHACLDINVCSWYSGYKPIKSQPLRHSLAVSGVPSKILCKLLDIALYIVL